MKIYSIQYLRGIAAIAVLFAHALLESSSAVDQGYVRMGTFGVLLFFVISGFIMVFITGEDRFEPKDFMTKRLMRIVPLYWAATFLVAAIAWLFPSVLKQTTFQVSDLIKSLFFVPFARQNGEIVPMMKLGWTLNYEVFFYVVFASAFWLKSIGRVLWVSAFLAAAVVCGQVFEMESAPLYFYTRPVVLTFCLGMWIGLIANGHRFSRMSQSLRYPVLSIGLILVVTGFVFRPELAPNPTTDAIFALGCGAIVLFCLFNERSIPRWRGGLLLGNASYSIYLVHIYFVVAVSLFIRKFVPGMEGWLSVVFSLVFALSSSILVYFLVERPIQNLFKGARAFNRA